MRPIALTPHCAMPPAPPRDILLIVADSLRYDSVHSGPIGLPYLERWSETWSAARAAGCWTLPATASLFTGLLPHEHGATAQSRRLRPDVPTLAERLKTVGYSTHQITANIATTEIFGLERGFDEVVRMWMEVPPRHQRLHALLVLLSKPRLRKKLFGADVLRGELARDVESARIWLQSTANDLFDRTRATLQANRRHGKRSFVFMNLMETHFPYHVAPTFGLVSDGLFENLRELAGLYHTVNMTWLTTGRSHIAPDVLDRLRQRQRTAWLRLAPALNAFIEEMHQQGTLVVFTADHGENFGEQGWLYHFGNVTDAGTRVPLFWLDAADPQRRTHTAPVSARGLHEAILRAAGLLDRPDPLREAPEESDSVLEAFWYNNLGRTLPAYRKNQIAFVLDGQRYLLRGDDWLMAPVTVGTGPEPAFAPLPVGSQPLEDLALPVATRARLRGILAAQRRFAATLPS
jgi:hypothetical protein